MRLDGIDTYAKVVQSFPGQKVDMIGMSQLVIDKFGAIEVTAEMFREPQPETRICTLDCCPLDRDMKVSSNVTLRLHNGFRYSTEAPLFLWNKRCGRSEVYFVLVCGEDFTLKYPVEQITITPKELFYKMVRLTLHTDKELVDALDEILHNM